jgi:oxygen-independent coproporphyrinogen-3 oxidase
MGCYVHIPFCVKKCAYCDFNSYGGYGEAQIRRYVEAIKLEIDCAEQPTDRAAVDTVFFGGGTPTAIPAEDEADILRSVLRRLAVGDGAEITTEANPGTADIAGLSILRNAGFNRISFGVQSFDSGLLRVIDRIHSAEEAKAAVRAAREAGFENVSIDLMYGLPGQRIGQWEDTLSEAFALDTDHLSMYALIVEEGTGFGTLARKGRLGLPDDDLTADMYALAVERAEREGFSRYEISNFAKPGRECRHNIHYWLGDDYHGFGAGAVSGLSGVRRTNLLLPGAYADSVLDGRSAVGEAETISDENLRAEAMMLGLRMTSAGVDIARFRERFGCAPSDIWPDEIRRFTALGLLEPHNQGAALRLTERGVFVSNEVMAGFVG